MSDFAALYLCAGTQAVKQAQQSVGGQQGPVSATVGGEPLNTSGWSTDLVDVSLPRGISSLAVFSMDCEDEPTDVSMLQSK